VLQHQIRELVKNAPSFLNRQQANPLKEEREKTQKKTRKQHNINIAKDEQY